MENQPPRTPDTRTAPQIPRAPSRPVLGTVKIYDNGLQYHKYLRTILEFKRYIYSNNSSYILPSSSEGHTMRITKRFSRTNLQQSFRDFVERVANRIESLYVIQNLDIGRIMDTLGDDSNRPIHHYTYIIVEYKIDMRNFNADIIVKDGINPEPPDDLTFSHLGTVREIKETIFYNEKDAKEAKEQGVKLREVKLGETFSLDEFRKLGPFCIERRLIYDDLSSDETDVGCLTGGEKNLEYPVLVKGSETENGQINEKNNQVYCVSDIVDWNVERGKDTDMFTRQYIKEIRIMNEKDIEEKEMEEYTKEEKTLVERAVDVIEERNVRGGMEEREIKREVKAIQSKLKKNTEEKKKRKQEKIRRMKMTRLMLFYKKLKF